jgi:hypothetical protein
MIAALLPVVGEVIKRVLPDKDAQVKAQTELNTMLLDGSLKEYEKQAEVIITEAKSDHPLTSQWRPTTMLTFVALIVAHWLGFTSENLPNEQVMALLEIVKIGLAGYVVGRSGEKIAKVWKDK